MSVVRQEARRRWSVVGAGVAVLCLLPAVVAAWPAPRMDVDPAELRELVLASAAQPYQGYVESRGDVGLPDLPALGEVVTLLGGSTRIRAWYLAPRAWRVAVLDRTGERDIYRTNDGTYVWDFERNLVTYTAGELPVRLPWAADLLPPDLARRLLAGAAAGDSLTAIGARRIAGVGAAGLRLTPGDPETTFGHVDVWADPTTGLPLQVEVAARGPGIPIFTVRFLDVEQRSPDPAVVTPTVAPSAGFIQATPQDLAAAINGVAPVALPAALAGRARAADPIRGAPIREAPVVGVGAYGAGLSMFVVLALPGRTGTQTLEGARDKGGIPVAFANAQGYETQTPLVSALIVRSNGDRRTRRTFLLAGSVTSDVLRKAATELLATVVGPR